MERLGEDETGTTHWKGRWKSKHLVVSICRGRILGFEEVSGGFKLGSDLSLVNSTSKTCLNSLSGEGQRPECQVVCMR